MDNACQVQTTLPDRSTAMRIGRELVERGPAACFQIAGPITSIYRWKGEVHGEREWLCLIKVSQSAHARLVEMLRKLHTYEVPEILTLSCRAEDDYLLWMEESSRQEE